MASASKPKPDTEPGEPPLLTIGEVAARLSVSDKTIRNWIAGRGLPAIKLGDGPSAPVRISEAGLSHWLDDRDDYSRLVRRAAAAQLIEYELRAALDETEREAIAADLPGEALT